MTIFRRALIAGTCLAAAVMTVAAAIALGVS